MCIALCLPRCSIFRRGNLCFACVCVCALCYFCAVKMLICFCSFSSGGSIFHQAMLCMHVWCVCIRVVCEIFMLPKCSIFRQPLVNMFHLSGRKVVFGCIFVHMCIVCTSLVLPRYSIFRLLLVKRFHILARKVVFG